MKALVVGGNSGIGLAIVCDLIKRNFDKIYIIGKREPEVSSLNPSQRKDFEKKVIFYF